MFPMFEQPGGPGKSSEGVSIPLMSLKGKTFEWTSERQTAFERMKAVLASDCILQYPDHNSQLIFVPQY